MSPNAQDQFKTPAFRVCITDITGIDHGGFPDVLDPAGF
jgi:hypothetical protein